ncbi:MAG: hypothetical protein RIR52_2518 [Acidobacteriota bacterium]
MEIDSLPANESVARSAARGSSQSRPALTLVKAQVTVSPASPRTVKGPSRVGLKKEKVRSGGALAPPPTPWGCEWRPDREGWGLWRSWSEKEPVAGSRIRKSRYAGHLSSAAWEVMREYDYETFLSIIGQQFRRHGKR